MTIYTKDSFVDTTGTNLESHTPSGTGATGSWTRIGGAAGQAKINANALEFAGITQTLYAATDNGTADHYAQAVMGNGFNLGSGYFPLVIRAVDASNFIGYRYTGFTTHELFTCVSGGFTNIGSVSSALNVGDTIYLEASGNSITVKRNGTTIIGPITNASLNTATKSGLITRSATALDVLRSWESGSLASYTYARPSSDVTTQWTPSTAGPHYALIDEVTYNDADYIYATAAAQTDEVGLQAMSIPTAGTDVLVNYRVQGITGSGSVTVSLYSGATLVKTDTTRTANNTSPAYYTMTVTAAEWGAVAVNWSNMRLRFVSA
jgi:hypothetical protein